MTHRHICPSCGTVVEVVEVDDCDCDLDGIADEVLIQRHRTCALDRDHEHDLCKYCAPGY